MIAGRRHIISALQRVPVITAIFGADDVEIN